MISRELNVACIYEERISGLFLHPHKICMHSEGLIQSQFRPPCCFLFFLNKDVKIKALICTFTNNTGKQEGFARQVHVTIPEIAQFRGLVSTFIASEHLRYGDIF